MSWLYQQTEEFMGRINEAKSLDVYPFFRPFQCIGPRVRIDGNQYINFTSNDYLGLSQDKRIIKSAKEAADKYGMGLGSSRIQATADRHLELEKRLAEWYGYPACAVFTTGYQSLVGVMSTFANEETTLVLDNLSHASILDGMMIAKGVHGEQLETRFFRHNSLRGARRILKSSEFENKIMVVEGVYSLDGDIAPLDEFYALAQEHNTPIIVDDAHGMGTLGKYGRGVQEYFNLPNFDFLVGTFSKSFGGVGGFVLGEAQLIEYMKNSARSFVFSASLPVPQVEAMITSLDIMTSDFSYLERLDRNTKMMREGLLTLGFDLGTSDTHITPIVLKDETLTIEFGAWLYNLGVIMIPILYPAVNKGEERLRCNITAAHTPQDIGMTLEILEFVGKKLGVIPRTARSPHGWTRKITWAGEELVRRAVDIRPKHAWKAGKFLAKKASEQMEGLTQEAPVQLTAEEEKMNLRRHFFKKNIVITGGSSGIGLSLARQLAELGANLFLVARREEPLQEAVAALKELAEHDEQTFLYATADVGERESIEGVLETWLQEHDLDILINNAGIAYCNYMEETDPAMYEEMMRVNYMGTVWASRAVMPHFKKKRRGHIVNVSSLAGVLGIFGYAAYAPSKFAVMGYSDVIRQELHPHNVKVSILLPPDTDTPQYAAENATKPEETKVVAGKVKLMDPDAVALQCLRGVASESYHIVVGADSKVPYYGVRWIPGITRWVIDRDLMGFLRKKEKRQSS